MHTAELDQHWIIEVKNLSVSFGEKQVLNNINFKVIQGETLGIVGESGSGKSITSLVIMSLISHFPIHQFSIHYISLTP